ncbi:PD-(D/E)XK nuclease family protein [bacterium]|nr:PD-(D/E)XK nuclease family protein [bacterium]
MHKEKIEGFFSDLRFSEEDHVYRVGGQKLVRSVSNIVKDFEKYTDFNAIAYSLDKKNKYEPGTMRTLWNKKSSLSCAIGNKAHYYGEVYALHRSLVPTDGYEKAIKSFWDSMPEHFLPVSVELKMYHKKYLFGGTADILLYNTKTGKYVLGDYKTNEDLFKNHRGQKLIKPFDSLLSNPYNKYQIQLSLYQILFEQTGLNVENRLVLWIKPDGTYQMYQTDDYAEILKKYLK